MNGNNSETLLNWCNFLIQKNLLTFQNFIEINKSRKIESQKYF
jgi:hypothetical protein